MTFFLRLINESDKASFLKGAVECIREGETSHALFDVDPISFVQIPGSPFAYWVTEKLRRLFAEFPAFESEDRMARAGLQSSDDFRFLRAAWEVPKASDKWKPLAKGGKHSPFYADINMKINWHTDGLELKAWAESLYNGGHWSRNIRNADLYFKSGIFQTLRANRLAPHITPPGCIFSDNGTQAFSNSNNILPIVAILNSRAADMLHKLLLGRNGYGLYRNGTLAKLPMPNFDGQIASLTRCAMNAWQSMRKIDEVNETSNAFVLPASLRKRVDNFSIESEKNNISSNIAEIDRIVFRIYGFDDHDIMSATIIDDQLPTDNIIEIEEDSDVEIDEVDAYTRPDDGTSLLSWSTGVVFGRFDWRLATAGRVDLPSMNPLDQLPEKIVGMLSVGAEPFCGHAGYLVDDPGHPIDIGKLIEEVLHQVDIPAPLPVRQWLRFDFFEYHLKQYCQSKRKAPIYLRIATSSGTYSVWLYIPALDKDTFFRIQQDLLELKIASEERALADMALSNSARLEIEKQARIVEELKQLADDVKRVSPLWNPNLDDGTVLVMAPLWRMVGHHKQWQKELRTRWEELQSGKHDWSHQAMHLWPERVVPKCAEDRSLAIAHDLEDLFWFETESGKWAKRDVPTRSLDEIVRERTSDAVKAALKELLEAPEPAATGSRSRRRA